MKKFYEDPQLLALTVEAEECISASAYDEDDNVVISINELLGK